jgi:F-type H+-transporting ATPase subunit c
VGAVDTGFERTHKSDFAEAKDSINRVKISSLRRNEMKKIVTLSLVALGTLMLATPVLAQAQTAEAAAASAVGYRYIAAGIGFAIAVFGGAIGQSKVAAAACEGTARNPGASARIQTMMILGLALIESLVLFALLVVFAGIK